MGLDILKRIFLLWTFLLKQRSPSIETPKFRNEWKINLLILLPNIMTPTQAMMNFSVVSSTQLWKSKITQALPLELAN